ncbi:MAG: hypothetical protein VKN60_05380 [Cyanobacteriota bacterium]|nr:hypothetical protein [Cyanobacteriota bacterium]
MSNDVFQTFINIAKANWLVNSSDKIFAPALPWGFTLLEGIALG